MIQLIKNPVGTNQALKLIKDNTESKLFVLLNDTPADGRDISWLWDADFEQLKDAQKMIVASGSRAYDMATRLKYAGIPQGKIIIEPDFKQAIEYVSKNIPEDEKITILPSYTALLKISKY